MCAPFRVFTTLVLLFLHQLVVATPFDGCLPSIISPSGATIGKVVGNQRIPLVTFTGVGVLAVWYCQQPDNSIKAYNWHVTYSYLDALGTDNVISFPETFLPAVLTHIPYFQGKTPTVDCTRPDTVTDPDEKTLCSDVLYFTQKNWPK